MEKLEKRVEELEKELRELQQEIEDLKLTKFVPTYIPYYPYPYYPQHPTYPAQPYYSDPNSTGAPPPQRGATFCVNLTPIGD